MTKVMAIGLLISIVALVSVMVIGYVRSQLLRAKILDMQSSDLKVFEGSELPSTTSEEYVNNALDRLIGKIGEKRPDVLIGVHTGGRLISALAWKRLGLPLSCVKFASTDMKPQERPFIVASSGSNEAFGTVLIVDDITRTGNTLEMLRRKFIRDMVSGSGLVQEVEFLVLLVAANRKRMNKGFFIPDWWAYFTEKQDVRFPWSSLSDTVRDEFHARNDGRKFDQRIIDMHHRLITDMHFALYCAELSISNTALFDRHVEENTLIKTFDEQQQLFQPETA